MKKTIPIMSYSQVVVINIKFCIGCGICSKKCPHGAIPSSLIGFISSLAEVDNKKCTGCGNCIEICPTDALKLINKSF